MKIMITAEEFFRNKLKEQNPDLEILTLSQVLITAEEGMQWAHEFKQLHLHDVVGQSEQLLEEQSNWLMTNTSLEVEKIVDFKEHFK